MAALPLHVLEVGAWAYLLIKLGSLDNFRTALLYSLNAITAYRREPARLENSWRLLGAIERLKGVMIFGLTTAFCSAQCANCSRLVAHGGDDLKE